MSKQKVDTTSQGCFLGHKPTPFSFPGHTQPSQEVGAAGRATRAAGEDRDEVPK